MRRNGGWGTGGNASQTKQGGCDATGSHVSRGPEKFGARLEDITADTAERL